MSSTSPVPTLTGNRDALAASLGMAGQARRISVMSSMGPGAGGGPGPNRSITPPTGAQQPSPNSSSLFLASLSSRLVSGNQGRSGLPPAQYPRAVGGGIAADIFDTASLGMGQGQGGSGFSGFRGNSHHANFGIPTSSGPPSTFDINEFPSLGGGTTVGGHTLGGGNAPGSNRPNYVGQVVKELGGQSSYEHPKPSFNMDDMDFPALPGSNPSAQQPPNDNSFTHGLSNNYQIRQAPGESGNGSVGSVAGSLIGGDANNVNQLNNKTPKRGIQTTKDGRVSNIPMGMVPDQFGMVGLLTFIRAAETEHSLVSLALGSDLTSLKLDLNSTAPLYENFSLWGDKQLKAHEVDYPVPAEYLVQSSIRDKLAPPKLSRYGDDILFYLFYAFPGDMIQLASAHELYSRDWRYHKEEKLWITRAHGMPPVSKTDTYERGTYYVFDPINWRRVGKDLTLEYDKLESKIHT